MKIWRQGEVIEVSSEEKFQMDRYYWASKNKRHFLKYLTDSF